MAMLVYWRVGSNSGFVTVQNLWGLWSLDAIFHPLKKITTPIWGKNSGGFQPKREIEPDHRVLWMSHMMDQHVQTCSKSLPFDGEMWWDVRIYHHILTVIAINWGIPIYRSKPLYNPVYIYSIFMSKAQCFSNVDFSLKTSPARGARVLASLCCKLCSAAFCQEEEDKAKIQKELSILTDRHLTRPPARWKPAGYQTDVGWWAPCRR